MDEKNTLKTYIASELASGAVADTITRRLVDGGWSEAIVGEAMREVTEQRQGEQVGVISPAEQSTASAPVGETTAAAASEDYGILDAMKDAYHALETNALGVGSMLVIGFVISVVTVVIGAIVGVGTVFMLASASSDTSQPYAVLALLFVFYLAIFSLISAFSQALIGLAVNDGAEGRKSNIQHVVVTAARRSLRVLAATLLCALIATGPALIALVLVVVFAAAVPSLAVVSYLLAIAAVIVGPLIALRVLLMPVIALFETDVPLSGLFNRTRHLMKNGGSWFIIKFLLVTLAVAMVLSIALPSERELENASPLTSLVVGCIAAAFAAFYSAVLVVFYRNRKAVRG